MEVEGTLAFIQAHDERNVHNKVRAAFLDGEAGKERFWVDFSFRADPGHWNVYEILHGGVAATLNSYTGAVPSEWVSWTAGAYLLIARYTE